MEIDRDKMGSERCKGNGVEFMKLGSVVGISLGDIPEWLLVELLIRLPVKLVFRFKLVSKEWLSVISDPSFVRVYISRASKSPQLQPWTFISVEYSRSQNGSLLDMHFKHPSLYELPCPSTEQSHGTARYNVVGVSNGLVLYGSMRGEPHARDVSCYGICNPITGQRITLPPHVHNGEIISSGFLTRVQNGMLTSFRVVRLDVFIKKSNMIRFEIFLSEIGEWKDFTVPIDQEIEVVRLRMPTSLNGILHWITRKHGIIAYDPYHNPKSLRFIALPCDIDQRCNNEYLNGMACLCDVHRGRLRYFEMAEAYRHRPHGFSSFGVWILNDYITGDWCLQHRIGYADVMYDDILSGRYLFLIPISFHPFDSDIVYLAYKNVIVSYNINTRKLEANDGPPSDDVKGIISEKRGRCWSLTSLLLIPPWPISIPHPSFVVTAN